MLPTKAIEFDMFEFGMQLFGRFYEQK